MDKISIIMATYNGEKFLGEQLDSIREQSVAVDEVLFADDCSNDNTIKIIQNYISSHNLTKWRLYKNEKNLGWIRNFIQLIFQAKGDIIFYCDQDDIWMTNKIEIMYSVMSKNEKILCLASQYKSVDEKGEVLKSTSSESGIIRKINANDRYFDFVPLGCTLAFRKELLQYIDFSFYICGIDKVIVRNAILLHGMYIIDLVLVKHRFHEKNVSCSIYDLESIYGSSSLSKRIQRIKLDIRYFRNLKKLVEQRNLPIDLKYIKLLEIAQYRLLMLKSKNIFIFFKLLIKTKGYIRFAILADWLYMMKLNKMAGNIYHLYKMCYKFILNFILLLNKGKV